MQRKLVLEERSLPYPRYPGQDNFSLYILTKLGKPSTRETKVGLAIRVTHLAGLPFFDSRVTLLARPCEHFGSLRRVMRVLLSALGSGKGVNFILKLMLAKVDLAWRVISFQGNFSPQKQSLSYDYSFQNLLTKPISAMVLSSSSTTFSSPGVPSEDSLGA